MRRRTAFVPYRPKTILNKHKRPDRWFWTGYSAYPYKGCQHGCEFCYCREEKHYPYDDPADFASRIQVKENAPDLLRRALSRVPVDVVATGDYQPAERKFEISRRMLEVCLELGFPASVLELSVLERSPLVLRDLDLLQAIDERATAVVFLSIVSTPDSKNYDRVCQMERLAPRAAKRFAALEQVACAGSYGAAGRPWRDRARTIRELCEQYGISDRMPRPVIPGHKRTLNMRVVEALAKQLYYMELDGEPSCRVWAYRKAAWAIEDLEPDLGQVYRQMGRKGLASLASIENVGPKLAQVVEALPAST